MGGAPSGNGDLDLWSPAYRSERFLHLADVGAVVWVGQLAQGGLADAQPAGKLDLGDAVGPHSRVQGELGGDDGRPESAVRVCEVAGTPRYENGLGIANWRGGFCRAPPRPQRGTSPRTTFPLPRPLDSGFLRSDELGYPDSRTEAAYRANLAATPAGVLEMERG